MPEFQLSHYPQVGIILQLARFTAENYRAGVSDAALTLEVSTKFRGSFHNIFLKAPTKAFSLLEEPTTSEFTRHYHYHKWIMHVSMHGMRSLLVIMLVGSFNINIVKTTTKSR